MDREWVWNLHIEMNGKNIDIRNVPKVIRDDIAIAIRDSVCSSGMITNLEGFTCIE